MGTAASGGGNSRNAHEHELNVLEGTGKYNVLGLLD